MRRDTIKQSIDFIFIILIWHVHDYIIIQLPMCTPRYKNITTLFDNSPRFCVAIEKMSNLTMSVWGMISLWNMSIFFSICHACMRSICKRRQFHQSPVTKSLIDDKRCTHTQAADKVTVFNMPAIVHSRIKLCYSGLFRNFERGIVNMLQASMPIR